MHPVTDTAGGQTSMAEKRATGFPLGTLFWIIIGVTVCLMFFDEHAALLTSFSILGLAHCAIQFIRLGGARITAGGIFLLGTGTFVFFPSILAATQGSPIPLQVAASATGWAYFTQVVMSLWWRRSTLPPADQTVLSPTGRSGMSAAMFFGVLFIAAGIAAEQLDLGARPFASAASYTGVVLLSISALSAGRRLSFSRLVVVLGAAGLYVSFVFTGGGRLVLGTLAVAIALTMNLYRPRRWHKYATIVALPTGLTLLAQHRSGLVATRSGLTETGLESVLSPFQRFAELLQMADTGELVLRWGETLLAPLVFFIPRDLWPGKPIGFGAELTLLFRPELAAVGHSEAALVHGEMVYNFGVLGLVILAPLMGYLIRQADRLLIYTHRRGTVDLRGVLLRTTSVLIGAGILDLVWVGAFGVSSRTGLRLLLILVLFILFVPKLTGNKKKPLTLPEESEGPVEAATPARAAGASPHSRPATSALGR